MNPVLLGDPLMAWRGDATLQVGWGTHSAVVEQAPAHLPVWLRSLRGDAGVDEVLARAERQGLTVQQARQVLADLQAVGLVVDMPRLRVSVASRSLTGEALREALAAAHVDVVREAEVVVFPQGQVPSLVTAPVARRLLPVWFGARAVHVGPVIDDQRGPCPRCVDLTWTDADALWPRLVAQAGSVSTWAHAAQMVQAAGMIALLAGDPAAVGLEMIADPAHPGPRWRVWVAHPRCPCNALPDRT